MNYADHIPIIQGLKNKISQDGRLIYLTISGSHLYGFNSPDSDIDYRGCFQTKTENLLGLKTPRDFIQEIEGETDAVLFELKKEIGLLLKSNCNVLEHLYSNPLWSEGKIYSELKELIRPTISKTGIHDSYRGMAYENYKKFILTEKSSIKKYLYVFRALLAGIHALEVGDIEPNIIELNKVFPLDEVEMLVRIKKNSNEKTSMGRDDKLDARLDILFKNIDSAYERSELPKEPKKEDVDNLNEWLRKLRVSYLG